MMPVDLSTLHLLRPDWLWALLALPVLALAWGLRRRRASVWRDAVDPHLLPHLLDSGDVPRRRWTRGLVLLAAATACALAVLALAGPSWRQAEQALWQGSMPLVLALDMSGASLAADPPPSRLAQARAKLAQLLVERNDGPVGLLVYADDAYTVAPVTDDAGNVALFLDALSPDIMPVDGMRADRAIASAVRLAQQAGYERGQVLLVAATADARAVEAAGKARAAGFEVAVLGLGRSGGVTYRDPEGRSAVAAFDESTLRRVATAGGGAYVRLTADAADLRALGVRAGTLADTAMSKAEGGSTWLDEGYWLLPPLMLLMLLAFRRGAVFATLLLALYLPLSPAQAADWWRRADQVEHRRMSEAADAYRKGDYAAAAERYAQVDSADGHYNRGNALAKAGRYEQALEAYDRALRAHPGMADATANRAAVEAALRRQRQSGEGDTQTGDDAGSERSGQSGETPKPGPADTSRPQDAANASGRPTPPGQQQDTPAAQPQEGAGQQAQDRAAEAPSAKDAEAQQAADAAQRQRMQQALEAGEGEDAKTPTRAGDAAPAHETPAERERRIANEAWLRRVPDDPGGLLREKFRIEYERRQRQRGLGDSDR